MTKDWVIIIGMQNLGIISFHKKDVLSVKSPSSTKVSKSTVSHVKSRLGVRVKSQDMPSA